MKKQALFIAGLALLGIISGLGAYSLTKRPDRVEKKENFNLEAVDIYNQENLEDDTTQEVKEIYYFLKREENFLVLYSVQGEERYEIKRVSFRPELFPAEDRRLLDSGIKAYSYEEGIAVIENFVS